MPAWSVPERRAALWFLAIVIAASQLPHPWEVSDALADVERAIVRGTDRWLTPSWLFAWFDVAVLMLLLVCVIGRHRLADVGLTRRGLATGAATAAALIVFGAALIGVLHLAGRDVRLGAEPFARQLVTHLLGVAVIEELFNRGFLLRQLWLHLRTVVRSPRDALVLAIAAESIIFAALHPLDGLLGFGEHLLGGAVYALLYARSGNLWLAVAFHGVGNATLELGGDDLARLVVDASFITLGLAVALRSAPPAAPAG